MLSRYELVYSPLLPCAPTKGTAVFLNGRVGEFWYDLILTAEPAPPEDLPLLECEVRWVESVAARAVTIQVLSKQVPVNALALKFWLLTVYLRVFLSHFFSGFVQF